MQKDWQVVVREPPWGFRASIAVQTISALLPPLPEKSDAVEWRRKEAHEAVTPIPAGTFKRSPIKGATLLFVREERRGQS
ncbi:hypothetical protein CEXT_313991 [Caerostris extrusa]|uniref:Uncharacterized protein n=1 Tax=Caerostris extrusa TaxID=172846 RepID=A0AAV4PAL8_CAEEX|nr:hypothetical protein CEXT_313991 [Caerostris extrusa]